MAEQKLGDIVYEYLKKASENCNILYVKNYYLKKREEETSGYLINYMNKNHNRTKHEVFIEDDFFTRLGTPMITIAVDHAPLDYYVKDWVAKYFYKIFKPTRAWTIGTILDTYGHKLEVICGKKINGNNED
jgi:hypothetical protein